MLKNVCCMYEEKHCVRYIIIFSSCLNITASWCYDALTCICCICMGMWMSAILDREKHASTCNPLTIQ